MLNASQLLERSKTNFSSSFLDASNANVVHLLVWQYWWWSLFYFFTSLYFLIVSNTLYFKNIKNNSVVLNNLKSSGKWGDLLAGILPVYWCINILLNSNMILKVLEWQTETSFFTLRVRGKQWYWVYKSSLNNSSSLKKKNYFIGKSNLISINTKSNLLAKNYFFKKNFLNKIVGFLDQKENFLNFFYFKKNNFDLVSIGSLNNNLSFDFFKFKNFNFFKIKKFSKAFKTHNRFWLTLQQQPKTSFNSNFKINSLFDRNISEFRNVNEFLKNNILVKNRLVSVDNTLYLPSRKNITVITNSFDVAHSWFVPGLGLKFDCIPGRSTHHSLFISKPGLYFGHCAEVCGRFHHHMPIKIIALSLDHFVYFYAVQSGHFNNKN